MNASRIDAHVHIAGDHAETRALFADLDVGLINVSVPQPDQARWRQRSGVWRDLAAIDAARYAWVCGFDLPTFDAGGRVVDGWVESAIADIDAGIEAGCVGCKIWKNIGMEVQRPSGEYVMVDDPIYPPIYDHLAARDLALLLRIGEPLACWRPLDDPEDPHYGYYTANPEWHMHGRDGFPSHEQIMTARDSMVAAHPQLRVVGAHLASLEWDVDEVAARLDRFDNFAVDTSARLLDLARQDPDKVRAFLDHYSSRVLWGTDIVEYGLYSELPDDERAQAHLSLRQRYEEEIGFYSQAGTVEVRGRQVQGLGLDATLQRRLFRDNAMQWYPSLAADA